MVALVRRMGIAFGSLVAAALCVGLVGSLIPAFALVVPPVFTPIALLVPGPSVGGAVSNAVVTIVLGGLIYRDILLREAARRG